MSSHKPVTAIFDIGKTNKKFLLFDENYAVIEKHQKELEQVIDEDGDPCEDLIKVEAWINSHFQKANEKHQIRALNFSAYGASLVHTDKNGNPVTPLYNYLKPYPSDLLNQFYETVGDREKFSLETASPPMGMLNSGLQLYWLKYRKPELFKQIETSLHLPNYLSFLYTGEMKSEFTSIGCHTALWDYEKKGYHRWLEKEGIMDMLPGPTPVTDNTETEDGLKIGPGIHDSSAALAPYLMGMDEPFMLISTGTWSITLNPFNDEPLTYRELERDCLCYLDVFGNQVKSSRLFLGSEYAYQKKKIEQFFNISLDECNIEPDVALLNKLAEKKNSELKLELETAYNSGPFPMAEAGDWLVHRFSSHKEAYHQLMLDLAAIQSESFKLVQSSKAVDKIIVTGGFSQNKLFISLLASFFRDKEIYTSSLPEASALGAALVVNMNPHNPSSRIRDRDNMHQLLGLKKHDSAKEIDLAGYSWYL